MVSFNAQWAAQAFSIMPGGIHSPIVPGLPFSFVYDGRPSAGFLNGWRAEVHEEQPNPTQLHRTLTLTDPQTTLEVRAEVTIYLDTPGVDWILYLTNRGAQDTPIIADIKALDVKIAPAGARMPLLHRLRGNGFRVDDWQPYSDPLPPEKRIVFAPEGGMSARAMSPFFDVEWEGGGVITAIGWSAEWEAAAERAKDGLLRIQAGQQTVHLKLHPGETIRTPRILQLYWSGIGHMDAYNLFRHTMLGHIVPRIDGQPVMPPIVHLSTSFYELNDSTEANVLSHLRAIEGLGFEYFWLDAYWTRDGFPKGMGHYGFPLERVEPPDRFPHGLRPIADAVHAQGLGFLVWFEPERVANGTHLDREHPEWVVRLQTAGLGEFSSLYNLAVPEAWEYMTKYLIAAIEAYGMDCLRIDYNFNPLPYWQALNQQDPERVGLGEIRYVEGLYRMWDEILNAYPHLFIDNCAGGGGRIDLELCARSIPLWRTDATIPPLFERNYDQAALQNQVLTAGLSRYLPFNTSGQMGATPYQFRSGFNGGISFCEDCRAADYPRELLKQAIAEGKRIRKYYAGDLHPQNEVSTSPEDWCVLQYHRPAEQDGMVTAFRRQRSPYATFVCDLRQIDPRAEYEVTLAYGYEPAAPLRMRGSDLQHYAIEIAERPGSLLLEYAKVSV
jgi:alpha-galactosidase